MFSLACENVGNLNLTTHSVTPADQMSTLNPEKVSSPLAISGGWKAGEPWLVRHVSSSANGWRAWKIVNKISVNKT